MPEYIEVPNGDKGKISDGYHTFEELYAHRCHLFLLLCLTFNQSGAADVFRTKKNDKGEEWPGWFILGMNTAHGQITYHLPDSMWAMAWPIREIGNSAGYDGHTSADVLNRLKKIIERGS